MSVRFEHQYFTFHKIQELHEDIGNPKKSYVRFSLSSSRKLPDDTREYSNWFAVARGDAMQVVKGLVSQDFIYCNGVFDRVPYVANDGIKKWPDAKMTIFEITKWVKEENTTPFDDKTDVVEEDLM
jgi:hypothetical protein